MARLALLAILLLALVPTLGRLAQARAAGGDAIPAWAALCTVRGLETRFLPLAAHAPDHRGHEIPAPARGTGGDCDYCPLLATAVPVAAVPPSLPPLAAPARALCTSQPPPAREAPHPCGLGSRGPPSVS